VSNIDHLVRERVWGGQRSDRKALARRFGRQSLPINRDSPLQRFFRGAAESPSARTYPEEFHVRKSWPKADFSLNVAMLLNVLFLWGFNKLCLFPLDWEYEVILQFQAVTEKL
jgi:hypothetical protein